MKREILEEIVKHNKKQVEKVNGDQGRAEGLYVIESDGQEVIDLFLTESMMSEVDPIKYYGEEKIGEVIKKWKNR